MDSDLRDSERDFLASGDVAAEAAWLRARLRQGELELRPLQTAAQLGYPAALAALGEEPGPPLGAPGDDLELLTRVALAEAREAIEWGALENERELLSVVEEVEASLFRGEQQTYGRELAELIFVDERAEPNTFPALLNDALPLLYAVQESEPHERPPHLVALRACLAGAEEAVPGYPPQANLPGPRRELARWLLGCPPPTAPAAEAPFLAALERYEQDPRAGYEALVAAGEAGGWSCAGRTWPEWFELLDSPRGGRSAGAAATLQRATREDDATGAAVAALVAARLSTPFEPAALRARVVTLGLARIVEPLPPQLGRALAPYLEHQDEDLSEGALKVLERFDDEDHDLHLPIARILAREITGVRVISTLSALELLGRSERGVAALDQARGEGHATLDFPRALCAFRATRNPDALARLREVFLDAEFCGGREGWLVDSAFQVLLEDPDAARAAAPELVSLVERMDRHHLAVRALQLLSTLGIAAQPWLPRLRAAVERVEEDDLRADLLELLEQIAAGSD